MRGAQLLTLAVISILLTAPIGSIGISISGPTLLSNEPVQPAKGQLLINLYFVIYTYICIEDLKSTFTLVSIKRSGFNQNSPMLRSILYPE